MIHLFYLKPDCTTIDWNSCGRKKLSRKLKGWKSIGRKSWIWAKSQSGPFDLAQFSQNILIIQIDRKVASNGSYSIGQKPQLADATIGRMEQLAEKYYHIQKRI
jgi:hypothetical protein